MGFLELVLTFAPLLLLVGLLLRGRFVGEARMVRALARARARVRRARQVRRPLPWVDAIRSLLEASARRLRGPPASLAV